MVMTVPTASQTPSAAGSMTFSIRSFILTVVWNGGGAGGGVLQADAPTTTKGRSHAIVRITGILADPRC